MKKALLVFLRLSIAGIFFQTLFFKFTGAPESVEIFSRLNGEPWGRWLAGTGELLAFILLLFPATAYYGALLSLGIISGALLSHALILGIEVRGDGGLLFFLALYIFLASLLFLVIIGRNDSTKPE